MCTHSGTICLSLYGGFVRRKVLRDVTRNFNRPFGNLPRFEYRRVIHGIIIILATLLTHLKGSVLSRSEASSQRHSHELQKKWQYADREVLLIMVFSLLWFFPLVVWLVVNVHFL